MVPSFRASSQLAALLSCASLALVASPAAAEVVYTLGRVQQVDTPDAMSGVVNVPQVFYEGSASGVELYVNDTERRRYDDEPVFDCLDRIVEPVVEGYFVFQNPDVDVVNRGFIVFSGEILGVSHKSECDDMTDPYFALSGVTYGSGGLGLTPDQGDVLEIFPGGRTIYHALDSRGGGDWDGYRIFTRGPTDDATTDVVLTCSGLDGDVMMGVEEELTLRLMNAGDIAAPDPQLVFRPPSSAHVARLESSDFVCAEFGVGIVECTYGDGATELRAGEAAELRVILVFDAVPMPEERLIAFGSGAVADVDLTNNECGPGGGGDAGLPDGGVGDGGARDGAVSDARTAGDAASVMDVGAGVSASFRGAGGCACSVARARDERGGAFGASVVAFLIARRQRRARRTG